MQNGLLEVSGYLASGLDNSRPLAKYLESSKSAFDLSSRVRLRTPSDKYPGSVFDLSSGLEFPRPPDKYPESSIKPF